MSENSPKDSAITLIGHPYATVGMGEQLRSYIAACRSADIPLKVLDIFRYAKRTDASHRNLVEPYEVTSLPPGGIRVFHINGDEIESVLATLGARGDSFSDGYNVIVPAWELPVYPKEWLTGLRKFNEVWALSRFIAKALAAVDVSSTYIGQPVEVPLGYFLPRKYFGIRESAFTLLHFFDLSSFAARKNPEAVLRMFEAIRAKRRFDDIQLVLKVKKGDEAAEDWLAAIRERIPEVLCLGQPMSALETRSLINCCDCFVSLHRAEGFGRGTGEAMFLGRVALATAWSGNVDYMTAENSLLVRHRLVPLGPGEYPFGENQVWADPDVSHAVEQLNALISDPRLARTIASKGRRDVRLGYDFRAVGVRILERITQILASTAAAKSAECDASAPPSKSELTA
jgi:glycosyltransferase involved in cell wall biosynthesis